MRVDSGTGRKKSGTVLESLSLKDSRRCILVPIYSFTVNKGGKRSRSFFPLLFESVKQLSENEVKLFHCLNSVTVRKEMNDLSLLSLSYRSHGFFAQSPVGLTRS